MESSIPNATRHRTYRTLAACAAALVGCHPLEDVKDARADQSGSEFPMQACEGETEPTWYRSISATAVVETTRELNGEVESTCVAVSTGRGRKADDCPDCD